MEITKTELARAYGASEIRIECMQLEQEAQMPRGTYKLADRIFDLVSKAQARSRELATSRGKEIDSLRLARLRQHDQLMDVGKAIQVLKLITPSRTDTYQYVQAAIEELEKTT